MTRTDFVKIPVSKRLTVEGKRNSLKQPMKTKEAAAAAPRPVWLTSSLCMQNGVFREEYLSKEDRSNQEMTCFYLPLSETPQYTFSIEIFKRLLLLVEQGTIRRKWKNFRPQLHKGRCETTKNFEVGCLMQIEFILNSLCIKVRLIMANSLWRML